MSAVYSNSDHTNSSSARNSGRNKRRKTTRNSTILNVVTATTSLLLLSSLLIPSSNSFNSFYSSCTRIKRRHIISGNDIHYFGKGSKYQNNQQQQKPRRVGTTASSSISNKLLASTTKLKSTTEEEIETKSKTTTTTTSTIQDESVDAPASLVFYDDVDNDNGGVVCARGVCVLVYDDDDGDDFVATTVTEMANAYNPTATIATASTAVQQQQQQTKDKSKKDKSIIDQFMSTYLGPRLALAFASILYGTNFPLGSIMNDSLPPSAATSARMVLASIALLPFLFQLNPTLAGSAILCGCFTALGYITQSLSLVDTSPATVAFLGAVTVIVCPTLEYVINKKPMSFKDAPQTWLAAILCLSGVGILELYDPNTNSIYVEQVQFGDILAILQAIGFGTSFFLTERMMSKHPTQALSITSVQVSTTAFLCMIWCFIDGWMTSPTDGSNNSMIYTLPNMFFEPTLQQASLAVVWTGIVTTALNRFIETTSLGKLSSAEASVILATEPLWAALFASLLLKEQFGLNDYVGGLLIVVACLVNTLKPSDFNFILKSDSQEEVLEKGEERGASGTIANRDAIR